MSPVQAAGSVRKFFSARLGNFPNQNDLPDHTAAQPGRMLLMTSAAQVSGLPPSLDPHKVQEKFKLRNDLRTLAVTVIDSL